MDTEPRGTGLKGHTIKNLDILKKVMEVLTVFYIMFNTNFDSTDQLKQYIPISCTTDMLTCVSKFINHFSSRIFSSFVLSAC